MALWCERGDLLLGYVLGVLVLSFLSYPVSVGGGLMNVAILPTYTQVSIPTFHLSRDPVLLMSSYAAALKMEALPETGATVAEPLHGAGAAHGEPEALGNASDVPLRCGPLNTEEVEGAAGPLPGAEPAERRLRDPAARAATAAPWCSARRPSAPPSSTSSSGYLYCGDISVRLDQAIPLHQLATKYSAEWTSVSAALLLTLLRRSDLVVQSELELYDGLEAWAARKNRPGGPTAERALEAIRYGMIPPQKLFRLQKSSPLMQKHYTAPCGTCSTSPSKPLRADDPAGFSFQDAAGRPAATDAKQGRVDLERLFSPAWFHAGRSTGVRYAEPGDMMTLADRRRLPGTAIIVTPATSKPGLCRSTEEALVLPGRGGTCSVGRRKQVPDRQRPLLHVVVKPVYHTLILAKK
ncbi:unnamed protein product [Arctogadus glacialis]